MVDTIKSFFTESSSSSSGGIGTKAAPKPKGKQKILLVLYEGGEAAKRQPKILGAKENALGIKDWLESQGHEVFITSDKDGENSAAEKYLPEANIVISQPFWPFYLTPERFAKAKNLKLAVTAGVGSDHTDITAAHEHGITVCEVTGSNVVSVAEHVVMMILSLVRNYHFAYQSILDGKWNIAECAERAWDLENKKVGTLGVGRIGYRVLQRLKPFGCKLYYYDKQQLPAEREREVGATHIDTVEDLFKTCDIVTINVPLHAETEELVGSDLIRLMRPGSYIVNTARGKIMKRDDVVKELKSGHLAGYAGDVWYPQPAPPDHPWRHMPHHGMTPHYSGTTLDAQARYAAGVKEILDNYFNGREQHKEYLILNQGELISPAYTVGKKKK